jgi:hypothetical protein
MEDTQRAKIERQCERLSHAYSRHLDFREYDQFVELFADDATLNAGYELVGKKAIAEGMSKRTDRLRSRHVVTNLLIDVIDEDHAEGLTYLTLYREISEDARDPSNVLALEGPAAIGHYTDKYVRTSDGWRFASRILTMSFQNPDAFPRRG